MKGRPVSKRTVMIIVAIALTVTIALAVWYLVRNDDKTASTKPSAVSSVKTIDPVTINTMESLVNSGDVSKQALALVPAHRRDLIAQNKLLLPKEVTIKIDPNFTVKGQIATTQATTSDHKVFALTFASIDATWLLLSAEVEK